MNRKVLILAAVLLAFASISAFSWGIGIQGGSDVVRGGGAGAVTFKLDSIDLIFGVEFPSFDPFEVGVTADYWFFNPTIANPLRWYLGVGGFAAISTRNSEFSAGARVPVGLNMFLADFFEIYLQVSPGIRLGIGNGVHPSFVLPANFGLRFWF